MVKVGDIVRGPFWDEPVFVSQIEQQDEYVRIVGYTKNTNRGIDRLLTRSDFELLKPAESKIDFAAPPEDTFFFIEATRFNYASLFDPLLAMSVSRIDPLPFQIEAVYGYILRQPRIRFLIADDPGAGKTIMSGLLIKELKMRKLANKILIVVPGHLKEQWIREMKEKFDERFVVLDRGVYRSQYGENPWQTNDQIITSIDFAKQEDILPALNSASWDLVIVDEAHKMAAYTYGEKTDKTQRYKLGETLSRLSNHLVFLTATPHKGDPENFRLFLDLLYPGFFASSEMVEESLRNKDNPLFIRRLKEDLKDFEGRPLFTRRFPNTIKFRLSDDERTLYNEVSRYIIEQYNLTSGDPKKRNIAFALMILQRRMASSTYALLQSLKRRKERLEKVLKEGEVPRDIKIDMEEVEDLEEEKRWDEEKKWEAVSLAANEEELKREIEKVENLIDKATDIIKNENEVKLQELRKAITEGFKKIHDMNGNPKILIFTESKDTLDYLTEKIRSWGYKVNYIHGGMDIDERIKAEKIFRDETDIMVATEAAGEGINLQFCHLMINYDIPWNPNRLEQRMGRIHRYGQRKDVYIFNLVSDDTREGKVLAKILEKLEEIRRTLGNDRVFDVIGDVFYGKNLYQLVLDAATNAKTMEQILSELDIKCDEEYVARIKEMMGETLATRFINYPMIKEWVEKARENKLIPEYVEAFFKKTLSRAGGKFRELRGGFLAVDSIPLELKRIAEAVGFKNRFGLLMNRYPNVTFDKEQAFAHPDAEFISFGHPLLEALISWVLNNFKEISGRGSVFTDCSGQYNGYIWFYVGEIKDGKDDVAGRRIIALYDDGNECREVNPAIIWDFSPYAGQVEKVEIEGKRPLPHAIKAIEKFKGEISDERRRQAEIKRKYGLKSLDFLIGQLDLEIVSLVDRLAQGEKVELPIRNKEEQKKRYELARKELEVEIQREMTLSMNMPELLTVIKVIPVPGEMVEDAEIEAIGMRIAMEYERSQGREPEDVSKENLGFDIRSKGQDGIRYIEVKSRANEGGVALTQNEWFKAKRFKNDYWLYIVTNAGTNPILNIIRNPAENLTPAERIEVVRFLISAAEWKSKKQEEFRWQR
ncbi:MAG: helicase-related protein [Candidatus Aminicenantales bacterium]